MKALVAYYSESDNTKKLAGAVASGLGTQPVSIAAVDVGTLADYDLICLGTPVQYGGPAREVRDFIARMPVLQGVGCAAFCTLHAMGDRATLQSMQSLLEAKGMVYLGGCSALGWSRLLGNIGPRIFNRGRPNREELDRAEAFARELPVKMGSSQAC